MSAKRIFITGASGFLGSHLLHDFTGRGFESYALVRDRRKHEKQFAAYRVQMLEGNMESIARHYNKELSSCHCFVHLAGEKRDETKMRYANASALGIILEEVVKHPNLHFILMSSAGVYGIRRNPSFTLDENVTCYPENLYEQTKLEGENLLQQFTASHALKYVILRPSNVFGEHDPGKKLLNLMRALQKENFFLINPRAVSNYVYAGQVTETVMQIIDSGKFTNEIFNVNSPLLMSDFISMLKSETGVHSKTRYMPAWLAYLLAVTANLLPARYRFFNTNKYFELTNEKIISAEKLKKIIPFDERQVISDGLKKLVAYYKSNQWL